MKKKNKINYISNKKKRKIVKKVSNKKPKITSEKSSIKKPKIKRFSIKTKPLPKLPGTKRGTLPGAKNIAKGNKSVINKKKYSYINLDRIKIGATLSKNYLTRLFKSGNLHLINQRNLNVYKNKKGNIKLFTQKQINYFSNPFPSFSKTFLKNVESYESDFAFSLFDPNRKKGQGLHRLQYLPGEQPNTYNVRLALYNENLRTSLMGDIAKGKYNRKYKLESGVLISLKDLISPLLGIKTLSGDRWKLGKSSLDRFLNNIDRINQNVTPERVNNLWRNSGVLNNECVSNVNKKLLAAKYAVKNSILGTEQEKLYDEYNNEYVISEKTLRDENGNQKTKYRLIQINGDNNSEFNLIGKTQKSNANVYEITKERLQELREYNKSINKGSGVPAERHFNEFLKGLKGSEIFKEGCEENIKLWDDFNDNELERRNTFDDLGGNANEFDDFDDLIREGVFKDKAFKDLSITNKQNLRDVSIGNQKYEDFVRSIWKDSNTFTIGSGDNKLQRVFVEDLVKGRYAKLTHLSFNEADLKERSYNISRTLKELLGK